MIFEKSFWCKPKNMQRLTIKSWISRTAMTLLIGSITGSLFALPVDKVIKGKVTDNNGEAIPGVNIIAVETSQGTLTDMDGKYVLTVSEKAKTLRFSFVGMKTQTIEIANKTTININFESDFIGLNEVVAVGYGSMKKSDVTGSISSLKASDFVKGNIPSADLLLKGKISGVAVTATTGDPGAASRIRIRGEGSIMAGNDPLYVIDGVPFGTTGGQDGGLTGLNKTPRNPLSQIDPNDIESIEVLKDASATAIYGSRGASGVILVTTKTGKSGKALVSYNGSASVGYASKKLDLMTGDQYRAAIADTSYHLSPSIMRGGDGGANTDWQDEVFRTAVSQSHNISISGGSEGTLYNASVGYTSQDGIVIGSAMERYNARLKVSQKALNDRLTLGVNINTSVSNYDNIFVDLSQTGSKGGLMTSVMKFNPTQPVYLPDGSYNEIDLTQKEVRNPVALVKQNMDKNTISRTMATVSGSLDMIKHWLTYNINATYDINTNDRHLYWPSNSLLGMDENGRGAQAKQTSTSQLLENNFTMDHEIFPRQNLNVMAGYSYQYWVNQGMTIDRSNFLTDLFLDNNLGSGTVFKENSSYKNDNKLISFYGRINYSAYDKYLLTATIRRDGSSRFGSNNKWGMFPSLAAGWRINQEGFMKDIDFISNLKLRAGYGRTGNQEIANYLGLMLYNMSSDQYNMGGKFVTAVNIAQVANPDIKWEQSETANLGLDFGFLNNKITGSLEYYNKTTKDLLMSISVPQPSPATSMIANVGSIQIKGFEAVINGVIIDKGDFDLSVGANIAFSKDEVLSLHSGNVKQDYLLYGYATGAGIANTNSMIIQEGKPLRSFYGRKFIKYDEKTGAPVYETIANSVTKDNRTIIGNATPDFTYGFNTNFRWKRVSVDMLFRGSYGLDVFNNTALEFSNLSYLKSGFNVLQSAVTEGATVNSGTRTVSSNWIEDASFLKLDNLTIGYQVNVKKLKSIQGLKVSLSGQNLLTFTNYTGYDPEASTIDPYNPTVEGVGRDYCAYPKARTYTASISVQF